MEKYISSDKIWEINKIFKSADDIYRKLSRSFGIPECSLWIIYFLRLGGRGITQKELCDVMYQSKQSINSALKKLEAEGYVTLSFKENSHKSKEIHLTEKGEKIAENTADKIIAAETAAYLEFTTEEMDAMISLEKRYFSAISRHSKDLIEE